jgi:ubiquinone/menaquinone biosynthesis C-methylase UbiE
MWRIWHRLLIRFDKDVRAKCLNYGYHEEEPMERLSLNKEDEGNRYGIQLYNHVAARIPLDRKDIVEVGSGRGGGASFLARSYGPRTYRAIDISSKLIDFCNRYYDIKGLSFHNGNAEDLPIENETCDVVVNVESARCYRSIRSFFTEVNRILRPGGYFMFADMVSPDHLPEIQALLKSSGFVIQDQQDITSNVILALDRDSSRREAIIRRRSPRFLTKAFAQFAGTRGTERYEAFRSGRFQYWSFVMVRAA